MSQLQGSLGRSSSCQSQLIIWQGDERNITKLRLLFQLLTTMIDHGMIDHTMTRRISLTACSAPKNTPLHPWNGSVQSYLAQATWAPRQVYWNHTPAYYSLSHGLSRLCTHTEQSDAATAVRNICRTTNVSACSARCSHGSISALRSGWATCAWVH